MNKWAPFYYSTCHSVHILTFSCTCFSFTPFLHLSLFLPCCKYLLGASFRNLVSKSRIHHAQWHTLYILTTYTRMQHTLCLFIYEHSWVGAMLKYFPATALSGAINYCQCMCCPQDEQDLHWWKYPVFNPLKSELSHHWIINMSFVFIILDNISICVCSPHISHYCPAWVTVQTLRGFVEGMVLSLVSGYFMSDKHVVMSLLCCCCYYYESNFHDPVLQFLFVRAFFYLKVGWNCSLAAFFKMCHCFRPRSLCVRPLNEISTCVPLPITAQKAHLSGLTQRE